MSKGDKATRTKAIPFLANFMGGGTTYGEGLLSFPDYTVLESPTIAIPMTRPEKGDIVEAYLFMEMTAPSNRALKVRLGIGTFDSGVIPDVVYSEAYLAQQHKTITGRDDPFTAAANGTLFIDADLTRSLHKAGDAEFNSDAFVLLVSFDVIPSASLGYSLDKFKLSCTAQMGLAT